MLRHAKLLSMFFSISLLSGCAWLYGDNGIIQNRDTDYLKATSIPPLHIPPGLSSSTIEAHYPVPDHYYPTSAQRVNLTPPELNKPIVMPVVRPVQPVPPPAPVVAPNSDEAAEKRFAPNTYYDPYTRASNTKAGVPIGNALRAIWPWGNKKPTQTASTETSNSGSKGFSLSSLWTVSGSQNTKISAQPGAKTTPNNANPNQQATPNGNNSAQNNKKTLPTQGEQTNAEASDTASQKPTEKSTMYYDRFTKR